MDIRFNFEDASQVIIGSFVLAVPVAFTQEAWRLGETLPMLNLVMVVTLSLFVFSLFAYHSVFRGDIRNHVANFLFRLVLAYALALTVVMLVLVAINKFPILTDPMVAIKRVLIVGMPSAMGSIIVDSLDKEEWID